MLSDNVSVQSDRDVIRMETEKKLKYKCLNTEIHIIWNIDFFFKPVDFVATEIVIKQLRNYLEVIWGKYSIQSLQKKKK